MSKTDLSQFMSNDEAKSLARRLSTQEALIVLAHAVLQEAPQMLYEMDVNNEGPLTIPSFEQTVDGSLDYVLDTAPEMMCDYVAIKPEENKTVFQLVMHEILRDVLKNNADYRSIKAIIPSPNVEV